MTRHALLTIVLSSFFAFTYGQESKTEQIDTIYISATRLTLPIERTIGSISRVAVSDYSNTQQGLSLNEHLGEVPGLFAQNSSNFAQDLRVSIRGFGSRAAFGIRGVKLIVDGIPETTPDGQGQIDNVSVGLIDNIEVIRGPSSSLYGNASGGVIKINNNYKFIQPFTEVAAAMGSYGFKNLSATAGTWINKTALHLNINHSRNEGYRTNSEFKSTSGNLKVIHPIGDRSKINFLVNFTSSPQADDPGGINLESAQTDRRQARDRNLLFQAGEEIDQLKTAVSYQLDMSNNIKLNSYGFYSTRNFNGRLPFEFGGQITLDRKYFGLGTSLEFTSLSSSGVNKFLIGFDYANQKDGRQRFRNLEGTMGDQTLNQDEKFRTFGLFLLDHYSLDQWTVSGGIRLDVNSLSVDDLMTANGDDSGDRNLSSINPSIGLQYNLSNSNSVFANFSTSFETPTLSELSANPSGAGGFNDELQSQNANSIEIGIKGSRSSKLKYSIVGYSINTTNEITSFEIEQFPGRDFFQNAGKTSRTGIELAANWLASEDFTVNAQYSYGQFKFEEFGNFDDNKLPGIPENRGSVSLTYKNKGLTARVLTQFNGSLFANNSNMVSVDAYNLTNIALSYEAAKGEQSYTPFFGVNNIFNTQYFDNIRINAFGSRFYEAAAEINIYGGVKVRLGHK